MRKYCTVRLRGMRHSYANTFVHVGLALLQLQKWVFASDVISSLVELTTSDEITSDTSSWDFARWLGTLLNYLPKFPTTY